MGETEADQLLRRQLEAAEVRRRQEQEAAAERDRQEQAQLARAALEKDREAAALIPTLLGLLKRLDYAGMEPVEIQREHRTDVPGKRKIRHLPTVVKAGWRIGEDRVTFSSTLEDSGTIQHTYIRPVYLLSDGRVVAAMNYLMRKDGSFFVPAPDGLPSPFRPSKGSRGAHLEDGTDAYLVPPGRYLERLHTWYEELNKRLLPPETLPRPPADPAEAGSLADMNMYERVSEAYDRAAVDAERARQEDERRNAEERARQQRETELRRYASRFARVLTRHGGQRPVGSANGWVVHEETDGRTIPIGDYPRYGIDPSYYHTVLPPKVYRYELAENGKIYLNGALVEGLTHETMNQIERGLANLAVWYRLDPELFRD